MKKHFAAALLSVTLLAGAVDVTPLFAQVSLGIRIGPPPQPRVLHSQPRQPGRTMFGSRDIGIQTLTEENTYGTTAIGHELHFQVPCGSHHTMMANDFSMAIGKMAIVEWITTIIGTTTEIATTVVSRIEG